MPSGISSSASCDPGQDETIKFFLFFFLFPIAGRTETSTWFNVHVFVNWASCSFYVGHISNIWATGMCLNLHEPYIQILADLKSVLTCRPYLYCGWLMRPV